MILHSNKLKAHPIDNPPLFYLIGVYRRLSAVKYPNLNHLELYKISDLSKYTNEHR